MLPNNLKNMLKKQHYAIVGEHSAVQICRWTKKSLLNQGFCYKQKFYGIKSHRCCQMTPSVAFCHHRCVFCWRAIEHTLGDKIKGKIDEPKDIVDGCINSQKKMLVGFMGNEKCDKFKLREAMNIKHFAISLAGEPTIYPYLDELIKELDKKNITSFLVSNGMLPKVIENLNPTQLYISLDAPNEKLYKTIDAPVSGKWENLIKTLELIPSLSRKTRTVLRLTLIRNMNMQNAEEYADLIKKSQPKFVEVKGYVAVGFSRQRLGVKFMPQHSEVKAFAEEIAKYCDYKIIDEKDESRVVLLAEDDKNRFLKFD